MDSRPYSFCGASLLGATAVGAGTRFEVSGTKSYAMDVRTTGTPTSFSVSLEGTIDGSNWVVIGTAVTAAGLTWNVDKPVRHIRANLTALTGGTAPTVTAVILGV